RARGILPLVLGPEMLEPEVRRQLRQLEQWRASLAQEDRRLVRANRQELPEPVHAGRALPERVLGDGGVDAREIVADGQHLPAAGAHGEELLGLVAAPAHRALDERDEGHTGGRSKRRGPESVSAPSPSPPWPPPPPCPRAGPGAPRSARTPWSSRRGHPSSSAGSTRTSASRPSAPAPAPRRPHPRAPSRRCARAGRSGRRS